METLGLLQRFLLKSQTSSCRSWPTNIVQETQKNRGFVNPNCLRTSYFQRKVPLPRHSGAPYQLPSTLHHHRKHNAQRSRGAAQLGSAQNQRFSFQLPDRPAVACRGHRRQVPATHVHRANQTNLPSSLRQGLTRHLAARLAGFQPPESPGRGDDAGRPSGGGEPRRNLLVPGISRCRRSFWVPGLRCTQPGMTVRDV